LTGCVIRVWDDPKKSPSKTSTSKREEREVFHAPFTKTERCTPTPPRTAKQLKRKAEAILYGEHEKDLHAIRDKGGEVWWSGRKGAKMERGRRNLLRKLTLTAHEKEGLANKGPDS